MSTKNALCTYDFTINNPTLSPDELSTLLQQDCKRWVFQLEEGENGTPHYQGRVSLRRKLRLQELIQQASFQAHWSPTTRGVHMGQDFSYVMKDLTRTDGPWDDRDYVEPPPLTRQLKSFLQQQMYPWQAKVHTMAQEEDDRSIKLIYDRLGNNGKSILSEFLEYERLALEIPPMRVMEDIMQFCMSFPTHKTYLVDMPRAMKKDKLGEFYAGLECLKNGYLYDKRYTAKKRRIDRPQVIVFTNCLPIWDFMSADRWEVWETTVDRDLQQYEIPERSLPGATL